MRQNFPEFAKNKLHNFMEAIGNLFMFFPYFFSVSKLLKTFFSPWKNLVNIKANVGFSFSEWGNRLFFNVISITIGVIMRTSIIVFYFIFQSLFIICLPFIILMYLLFIPFSFFISVFEKTEQEKKDIFKKDFLKAHLLNEENRASVEEWFEKYYQNRINKTKWWQLSNLFSFPPLARDWAVGYTPTLDQYSIDLANISYLHHIKNMVDRQKEISEIEKILTKNSEANVVIVGEEGVGKHTIIDALAKKIYLGNTNVQLTYKRILKLNMEKILSEFTEQKQRENFFENLLKEAANAKNIILLIDGFEKYISYDIGKIDLTNSIEKYGKTDSLQIIGLTTPFFYEKFFNSNDKINRIFSKIDVFEVSKTEALSILLESAFNFESYYNVKIPYETLVATIEKSEFYLTYIPFPEKSVDLLDTTCAYVKSSNSKNIITPEIIDQVLTEKTHIPMSISSSMKEKLLNLETLLFSSIVSQEEAINKLASSLRRSFLLIGKRKKPLATFLFLGPTGVGKTQTAKAVNQVFFPNNSLIRFDMSLYQSKSDIPKLIGDSSTNQPGLLTAAIREQSYGVLLLDELEKADHDLLNIFLTILDEGYFTDGFGKHIDCKNLIIIATSNAGNDILYKSPTSNLVDYLVNNHIFSLEFLNRFDGVIAYRSLDAKALMIIGKKIIDKITEDVFSLHKVKITVSDITLQSLVSKSYDPRFGARNLERVIRDEIEDKIAKTIFIGKIKTGEKINL
jgi:ATP-dependent Clp protease ATP-binding subunit ClpA